MTGDGDPNGGTAPPAPEPTAAPGESDPARRDVQPTPPVGDPAVTGWRRGLQIVVVSLVGVVSLFIAALCLDELEGRQWVARFVGEQIVWVSDTYRKRLDQLAGLPEADRLRASETLKGAQTVLIDALIELRNRVSTLAAVGSDRMSRTSRGVADIVESLHTAHELPDSRLKQLLGPDWSRPAPWTLEVAVRQIVSGTAFRQDAHPPDGDLLSRVWGEASEFIAYFPTRTSSSILLYFAAISSGVVGAILGVYFSRGPHYAQPIFCGATFGLLSFIVLKAGKGVFLDSTVSAEAFTHYTIAVTATVAGMYQDRFRSWLETVIGGPRPAAAQGAAVKAPVAG